jgi:hypothetical protein
MNASACSRESHPDDAQLPVDHPGVAPDEPSGSGRISDMSRSRFPTEPAGESSTTVT